MFKLVCLFVLAFFATSFLIDNATCTHEIQVLCVDDINKAYVVCEKAAEKKGKDIPADLECIQYSNHVEKDCWPCICLIATTNHWKIKGC